MSVFRFLQGRLRSAVVYSAFVGLLGVLFSVFLTIPTASAEAKPVDAEAWEKLAQCESNGDWSIDTGNGFSGGVQFTDQTWAAYGGTDFAPKASKASKEEQMYVANKVLEEQGWKAWPACSQSTGIANEYKYNPDFPKPDENSSSDSDNEDEDSNATVPGEDSGEEAEDSNNSGNGGDSDSNDSTGRNEDEDSDSSGDALGGGDSEDSGSGDNSGSGDGAEDSEGGGQDDDQAITDPYGKARLRIQADEQLLRPEFGSPAQYAVNARSIDELGDAVRYLGFHRFKDADSLPDSGSMSIKEIFNRIGTWIASFIFNAVFMIGNFIGMTLIFVLNTDIVGRGVYFADLIFARLATNLTFSPDDSQLTMISKIMFFVILAVVATWVWQMLRPNRMSPKEMVTPMLGAAASIFAVAFFGTQAAKNHPSINKDSRNLSTIGQNASDEDSGHVLAQGDASRDIVVLAKDPKNWTVFSPGWAIAWINYGAKYLGSVAGDLTGSLFSAIRATVNPDSEDYTECDLYMQGMYAVFMNTPAARSGISEGSSAAGWLPESGPGQILMSYDRMYMATVHKMWEEAGFGTSDGAGGAWCRVAESYAGSHPADQAMISRVAGLYSEVVGTGGLGMVATTKEGRTTGAVVHHAAYDPSRNGRSFQPSGGTLVQANGNWNTDDKSGDQGQTPKEAGISGEASDENNELVMGQYVPVDAATNYFGPVYRNQAGEAQAKFYFAGCDFTQQGQPSRIRAEWRGATRAMINEPLIDEDCSGTITNGENDIGGFGQRMHSKGADDVHAVTASAWNFSPHRDDNDAEKELFDSAVEESEGAAASVLKWVGNKIGGMIPGAEDASFMAKSALSDTSGEITKRFRGAERTGAEELGVKPLDREGDRPSKAGNAPQNYFNAVSGKNISGIMYGLMALFLIWFIAKSFLPILLGALISQAVVIVFLMVSALMIVFAFVPKVMDALKTALTTVISAMLVVSIIQLMMDLIFNLGGFFTTLFNVEALDAGLMRAAAVGLAYIMAFKLVIMLASKLTAIDMSTIRGAATAGIAAGAPALQGIDAKITSPLSRDFWRLGRADEGKLRALDRRAKNLGTDARNAINQDAKKRRIQERDAAERAKGNRKLPISGMPGGKKGFGAAKGAAKAAEKLTGKAGKKGVASALKGVGIQGAKKLATQAATKNPYAAGAYVAAKGGVKALKFGKKGIDATRKGAQALGATASAASNILNPDGKNGANLERPMRKLTGGKGMPSKVAGYRGANSSSGGSLVSKAVRANLDGHPLRALKKGKLTDMANSALGFTPGDNGVDVAPEFQPLTADNLEETLKHTPGLRNAPVSEAIGSDVDSSRFDETRRARQDAFMLNRNSALNNMNKMSPEEFAQYMSSASTVGTMAGSERETFITDNGLPTQQFSTAFKDMTSTVELERMKSAGVINEEMHRVFSQAIDNGVDLNNLEYANKSDELSRMMQKFHSQQNLSTFEEMGVLNANAKAVLQNAVNNGRDIVNVDVNDAANRDIVNALSDVAATAEKRFSVDRSSVRQAFTEQFRGGGYRSDYVNAAKSALDNKKVDLQRELELSHEAAQAEYEKNAEILKQQFVDAKQKIMDAKNTAGKFAKIFREPSSK